jgi:hypothetical protein
MTRVWNACGAIVCCGGLLLGCSGTKYPPLAEVQGIVRVDGEPAGDLTVLFQPRIQGRSSTGVTDREGRYSLAFTESTRGAIIGPHVVTFSIDPDVAAARGTLEVPKYLRKTFDVEVRSGKNTYDFDLSGK